MAKQNHEAVVSSLSAFLVNPLLVQTIDGINPRKNLDIDDLKKYIRNNGITSLPPIRVFERDGTLYLAEGHRRLAATVALMEEGLPIKGLPAMYADKRDTGDDRLLLNNLTSNQGKALEPLEVAEGIKRLIGFGHKQSAIATLLGKTPGWVTQTLSLLDASPEVKAAVESGEIKPTAAQQMVAASKAASTDKQEQAQVQAQALAANKAAKAAKAQQGPKTRIPRPAVSKPELPTMPVGKLNTPTQDDTDPSMIALNQQLAKQVRNLMQSFTLQRILTEFLNYESKALRSANVAALRTCIAHLNGNEASTKLAPSASKVQPVVHVPVVPETPPASQNETGETEQETPEQSMSATEHTIICSNDNNTATIKTGTRGKPGVWNITRMPTKKNQTMVLHNAKGETRTYNSVKKVSATEYQGVLA